MIACSFSQMGIWQLRENVAPGTAAFGVAQTPDLSALGATSDGRTYVAPLIVWVLLGAVVIYAVVGSYFETYLEAAHRDIWVKLGKPSGGNRTALNGWLTFKFVLSGAYRGMNDLKLAAFVWALRILPVIVLALAVASPHGPGRAPPASSSPPPLAHDSAPPLLWFALIGSIFFLIGMQRLLSGAISYRLRQNHRELWARLGSPDPYFPTAEQVRVQRIFLKSGAGAIADRTLNRTVTLWRWTTPTMIVLGGAYLALTFYLAVMHGR